MVSIENLQRSQPTRPRHWIPVYCAIVLVLCLLVDGLYALCALDLGEFSTALYDMLPNIEMVIGDYVYGKAALWMVLFLPVGMVVINLFALIVACRMASFRKAYWWYASFALIAYIAMVAVVTFENLFVFVPFVTDGISKVIPREVLDIIYQVFVYGNIGYSAMLIIALIFGLFYCVNYPAKYERIYTLRKRHLKALRTYDEKVAYKKRFYRDYKKGKWISMMLDLHAESLQKGSVSRMDQDAYDFLVYYSCLCDSSVKKAVFDEYARNGRYYECRNIYHEIKAKADAVEGGAKIRIPTHQATAEPRIERRPKPVKKAAPPAPKRRHYRPDEI